MTAAQVQKNQKEQLKSQHQIEALRINHEKARILFEARKASIMYAPTKTSTTDKSGKYVYSEFSAKEIVAGAETIYKWLIKDLP